MIGSEKLFVVDFLGVVVFLDLLNKPVLLLGVDGLGVDGFGVDDFGGRDFWRRYFR